MRKSSNSPLAAISLPSISHRRSGTAHRKSVQHERHELPWPDPIDQNADAHRHENDQGNIVHMQLKAQEMNRQDVNQINGEAGAGYDVDRPPKIGRAHVRTPVTNAHIECRLLLETKKHKNKKI